MKYTRNNIEGIIFKHSPNKKNKILSEKDYLIDSYNKFNLTSNLRKCS